MGLNKNSAGKKVVGDLNLPDAPDLPEQLKNIRGMEEYHNGWVRAWEDLKTVVVREWETLAAKVNQT